MLNQTEIKNNWPQIKTQIRGQWTRLTEDELEKTHGNVRELNHLVNSKYGFQKNFERDLEKICDSCVSAPIMKENNQKEAARDEYRSPQNPKKETQTPKMQNGNFSTQSSTNKKH